MPGKSKRYLTKSRFKIGYECPTKLFYQDNKRYGSNNADNAFLEALAEGGFQVGELAKCYHPGGTEIVSIDKEEAAAQTHKLLQNENAIIYEGSIKFERLFIKADILLKRGNEIHLIEVKAKSFDSSEENPFLNKTALKAGTRQINSEWEPYLMDVAFQAYVFKKVYPDWNLKAYLMLADKNTVATVDGLNQRFFLKTTPGGQVKVSFSGNSKDLGKPILTKVNVDSEVQTIWKSTFENAANFEELVSSLVVSLDADSVSPSVGSICKSCEFRIGNDQKAKGLESGFEHCWSKAKNLKSSDFERPFIFDVWNFRKAGKLVDSGKIFMEEIEIEEVSPSPRKGEPGLSSSERQWLQIETARDKNPRAYIDLKGLRNEMALWKFPLHFIDFETTMVAIPFNKGRKPYEQIAFQFSHHTVSKDGKIRHESEYINRSRGHFPNFDFVRELKRVLSEDNGSIFRYAAHENTVLCQIRRQLLETEEKVADKFELIKFIESITSSTDSCEIDWEGARTMIDLCDLVKRFSYYPEAKGSNSIKKVLPAIINSSEYIQSILSKPVYGTSAFVSKNFANWKWLTMDRNQKIADPYSLLPPIFSDLDLETMDSLITEGSIADGGAAMTSYSRMQFTEMSDAECERVTQALLKYCELDTFAMVIIYMDWKNAVEAKIKSVA